MDREAWIFFSVFVLVQAVVLGAYGRVVRRWWDLLPASLPADWIPFTGDRLVRDRPAVELGPGWVPSELDPGAVWRCTVVEASPDGPTELIVLRRARFAPPAGPAYRVRLHPMAAHAAELTGLRAVPCTRSLTWVRANRAVLERLRDEPDGVVRLLAELGVAPSALLVTPPVSLAEPI